MSSLPLSKPAVIPPSITTVNYSARPASEFDAGINASNAWVADHADKDAGYLSDDDDEAEDAEAGRQARVLYDFEGKTEFRELTIRAGDELSIIKEDLDEGWSVARADGKVGLIPKTYYAFTSEMLAVGTHGRGESSSSLTPRGSPRESQVALPLRSQSTGEWFYFPSFRQSLLGGKSLNRFSSFVTTGAEDWVLQGNSEDIPAVSTSKGSSTWYHQDEEQDECEGENEECHASRPDRHFIETGPAWKTKLPTFRVMVHSPSKRSSVISGAYTIYLVTSLFFSTIPHKHTPDESPPSPTRITVHRRFSHFVFLHKALARRLPGIALPPLPEKQYAGRFSDEFVEARRGDLERYLSRVIRHPLARYTEVLTFFLSCESDIEWNRLLPQHLNAPPAGAAFYSQVYHPAFNLDAEDASEAVDRFERHLKAMDRGVQGMRSIFEKVRTARLEMSNSLRLLSYGLLSLITSTPIAGGTATPDAHEEEDELLHRKQGLMNNENAWCWRDGCEDCLKLTKALQKAAESLQSVADMHDDSARQRQLSSHEALKDVAHPSALYASVVETHRAALKRYTEATDTRPPNDDVAARCETVLNTTMAEFDTYHSQKVEDFERVVTDYLDGEIDFYEQVVSRLRAARATFNDPQYGALASTPRQPSIYERELANPRLAAAPLPLPCPHVFDSVPMRPVSVAIGGMSVLLGGGRGSVVGTSRTSVLGKFW
ncbi:PX-domain-containing protein [Hysterangium stoloniferum]|nr:PX-domain-containing protein [Hysterangium stoloniferum]